MTMEVYIKLLLDNVRHITSHNTTYYHFCAIQNNGRVNSSRPSATYIGQ